MNFRLFVCGVAMLASATPGLAQDAAAGAAVFRACQACHAIDQEQNRVGPHLVGVVGRPVASVEGYAYSEAMVAYGEGKTWDEATLTEFLANPRGVVEGTKMAYAGVKDEQKLADLIAYLAAPPAQ